MQIDLAGRRAVVTGSTSGIGFAIARGLAGAGAHVTINGRNAEVMQAALRHLRSDMPNAHVDGIDADLATGEGVDSFIARAADTDILVNNLGIYEAKAFEDITDADWTRFFDVNVLSGIRLSRHYLPAMRRRNWGRLLFITSESGVTPPGSRIHYATTKAAQIALARGIAVTLAGTAITCNSIVVGITRTEQIDTMIAKMAKQEGVTEAEMDRKLAAEHRPTQLLQRLATAEEVANMVVYAASPQASATNGAALRVEGGGIPTIL